MTIGNPLPPFFHSRVQILMHTEGLDGYAATAQALNEVRDAFKPVFEALAGWFEDIRAVMETVGGQFGGLADALRAAVPVAEGFEAWLAQEADDLASQGRWEDDGGTWKDTGPFCLDCGVEMVPWRGCWFCEVCDLTSGVPVTEPELWPVKA
jgi:hypothetical protein